MTDDAATLYSFARNLVVVASAGTGKTHSLVGVLVHLVMGACADGHGLRAPVDPSRIVATTFSRKAAAEIRGRLVEELERLVNGDEHAAYRADLLRACDRAGVAPWNARELAERARRALDGLGRAQVSTLHGFATSLVRSHAFELGLSPGFDFADETVSRDRTYAAIGRVLDARADRDDAALRGLVTAAGGVERLMDAITAMLARLAEDGRGAKDLVWDHDDARGVDRTMQAMVAHARDLVGDRALGGAAGLFLGAHASEDSKGIVEGAAALCGVPARGAKSPAAEAFFAFREELAGAPIAERGRKLARAWLSRGLIAPALETAAGLLIECEAAIDKGGVEDCTLGFGDVLRAARNLLRDHPHVAAEVGAGIDALLVDEFQDTSRLQRDLVLLLWERDPNGRRPGARPSLAGVRGRGLLVVGDRKQSIYGFRGADVAVFAEVCVGLAGARAREALGIAAGETWEPEEPAADFLALRHNRRGRDELLSFANAYTPLRLRPVAQPPELFEIEYVPETEDLLPPPERAPTTPPAVCTTWLRVERRGDALCSRRLDEAGAITERILAIIGEGAPTVRGSAPRWRDIAVLALRHDMLDATAYALARAGVPYVVAGKGFYAAREVRDLASMLALVLNPGDKLAMVEVLRGAWAGVSDETLLGLTNPHAGIVEFSAWDAGERRVFLRDEDREALLAVRTVVERLRVAADRLGPAEVLRQAVRALAFEETLILLPRGEQRVANVRKLLAIAERATDGRALLAKLNRAKEREDAEIEAATFSDEDDAVRLLTVHASKGLDFPIVFLPEVGATARSMDRGPFAIELGTGDAPSTLSVRFADEDGNVYDTPSYARLRERAQRRELAERARLSYVAATRASEAMFFVGDRKPPSSGPSDAFQRTVAASLLELASDAATCADARLEVIDVPLPERVQPVGIPVDAWVPRPDPKLALPTWRSLPIATTALQDFHHCPRRFQLRTLLDLPETAALAPVPERPSRGPFRVDARAAGTRVHRVLERVDASLFGREDVLSELRTVAERDGIEADAEAEAEVVERAARFLQGPYASRIAREHAELLREQSFVLRLDDDAGRSVVLRGTIDLLVSWPDGSVDVIDYKSARTANAEPYGLQLDAYAMAAEVIVPSAQSVRAGLVFLGMDPPEPIWRDRRHRVEARARLASLGQGLVSARWTESFPRVAVARCRAIRCGYIGLCHPDGVAEQLSLFRG